jgi:hypothetical protein
MSVEEREVSLPGRIRFSGLDPADPLVVQANARLQERGVDAGAGVCIEVDVRIERGIAASDEAYALEIDERGVRIRLASQRAARHALSTLVQFLLGLERTRAGLAARPTRIVDAPDFASRGAMLDVSRTRVPRMETLFALVDRLATFKLNQLQLYTEHTFAYAGHEDVWRDASPFTPAEIRDLDRFCGERGVELVPNQQSLGHMHRWLKHARYQDLAEVPEGVDHSFSIDREPYSLDLSTPRALALLDDLYDQLLPCFSSHLVNVGLDETFDLGMGRARGRCAELGVERVYLEYLKIVHAKVRSRGRRMQFWGDIIVKRPDLVPELPRDAIALEWGYDEGHPFAEHARIFAASGLEFYVCPGTSSWQSIGGRSHNMLANLSEAARAGKAAGASGYLVTEWGDRGYLQPRAVSAVGLALGAGCAWNAASALSDRSNVARVLDDLVFEDRAGVIGSLLLDLGRAGDETGARSTNGSPLFFLLAFAREPLPHPRLVGLGDAGLLRARDFLESLRPRVSRLALPAQSTSVSAELELALDLLVFACDFGRARLSVPAGSPVGTIARPLRLELAARLARLISTYRDLWLSTDRPGGLEESAAWLERVRLLLES